MSTSNLPSKDLLLIKFVMHISYDKRPPWRGLIVSREPLCLQASFILSPRLLGQSQQNKNLIRLLGLCQRINRDQHERRLSYSLLLLLFTLPPVAHLPAVRTITQYILRTQLTALTSNRPRITFHQGLIPPSQGRRLSRATRTNHAGPLQESSQYCCTNYRPTCFFFLQKLKLCCK